MIKSLLFVALALANFELARAQKIPICTLVFAPADSLYSQRHQSPANLQERVWNLRREGKSKEAESLEAEIVERLQAEKPVRVYLGERVGGLAGKPLVDFGSDLLAILKEGGMQDRDIEVLAYRVDRSLKWDIVPITVFRSKNQTLQIFIFGASTKSPEKARDWRVHFLNYLLGNYDVDNTGNMLVSGNKEVPIDFGMNNLLRLVPEPFKIPRSMKLPTEAEFKAFKEYFHQNWQTIVAEIQDVGRSSKREPQELQSIQRSMWFRFMIWSEAIEASLARRKAK